MQSSSDTCPSESEQSGSLLIQRPSKLIKKIYQENSREAVKQAIEKMHPTQGCIEGMRSHRVILSKAAGTLTPVKVISKADAEKMLESKNAQ